MPPSEDHSRDRDALVAAALGADDALAVARAGTIVTVTDRWCECWDCERAAVVDAAVGETAMGADGNEPPEPGETVRLEHKGERTLSVTAEAVDVDESEYVVYTTRDVTDLVELEQESNVLDALFEHIPVHLYLKDEDGRHLRVSDNYDEPERYLGKTDAEIFGDELAVDTYSDDQQVIEEGEPIINRQEYNDELNEYFLSSKVPWRDENGEIRGLIGVTRDVSERERKRRQLRRQNERLRTVSSVISHDIRNPLQVARGRLDILEEGIENEHLDRATESLDRMGDLLENLLTMVKQGRWVEETSLVSVQAIARDAWRTAGTDAASLSFDQEFYFEADPDRLQELFENLFRNAIVHVGPDVTVRIGPLDDWSGFYVEDDGPGIPDDERDQVFESGYTTAEEGTGFGLPIVETIAEAHGWDVRLAETDDGGARFEFVGVVFE